MYIENKFYVDLRYMSIAPEKAAKPMHPPSMALGPAKNYREGEIVRVTNAIHLTSTFRR